MSSNHAFSASNGSATRVSVSLIVPVFNGGKSFEFCLSSLLELDPRPDEIIIVDDGSTDGSGLLANRLGFTVIPTDGRSGPAYARNTGAKHSLGDILFFVDADCSVQHDAVSRLTSIFMSQQEVDAVVGSYDDRPSAKCLLSQYKNLLHHYTHQNSGPIGHTFWGACGAIRRDPFVQLGGFDESYTKPSVEDIELGYRLVAAGKQIRMCPELQVTHHKQWRPLNLLYTDVFRRAIPWSRLILREGRMHNTLNISRLARLRVALSGLVAVMLLFSPLSMLLLGAAVLTALFLLIADWPVLRWFYKKRGLGFTVKIVPWHWFSHLYSGVSFAIAVLLHKMNIAVHSRMKPTPKPAIRATGSL